MKKDDSMNSFNLNFAPVNVNQQNFVDIDTDIDFDFDFNSIDHAKTTSGGSSAFTTRTLNEQCKDMNLAEVCQRDCADDNFKCLIECGTDSTCTSDCNRAYVTCEESCV